jgi:hypothetical protein
MKSIKDECYSDHFALTLKGLYERVKLAIPPPIGTCWAVDIGCDRVQKCCIMESNKWKIDVGFDEWAAQQKSNGQLPLVQWIKIKKDIETKTTSVHANRKFVAGEIIGLFCGDRLRDGETPSEFAFENKHGIYDAEGEFDDFCNMAVHVMRLSFKQEEFNAKLSNDFLVRAVQDIEVKEEIILTFDKKTVWKPKNESIKSTKSNKIKKRKFKL